MQAPLLWHYSLIHLFKGGFLCAYSAVQKSWIIPYLFIFFLQDTRLCWGEQILHQYFLKLSESLDLGCFFTCSVIHVQEKLVFWFVKPLYSDPSLTHKKGWIFNIVLCQQPAIKQNSLPLFDNFMKNYNTSLTQKGNSHKTYSWNPDIKWNMIHFSGLSVLC